MALVNFIEDVKGQLHRLIVLKNYFLQDGEIIALSQYLDKLISIFQSKNYLLVK